MREPTCNGRILIVEDERVTAADLQFSLKGLGYEVVANVASGEEAVAFAARLRPDVAIMDIRLRGEIDGLEAGTRIRAQYGIAVVYLSAYVEEVRECGAAYIRKPFTLGSLCLVLDNVLTGRQEWAQYGGDSSPDLVKAG